jgi:tRNA (guanine-N7-)-methyltransferase
MSPTRQRAFDDLVPRYALDVESWRRADEGNRPLVVEIGCGKGDATAAMAPADGDALVVACEPNAAMISHLALLLDERGIDNVRLWLGDAFDLLARLGPGCAAEVRIWFPDPWPKPRHAGKRLMTAQRLALIVDALAIGGSLRLATDDPAYAAEALSAVAGEKRLRGGVVPRPPERPITVFEQRGLREDRPPIDLRAERIA